MEDLSSKTKEELIQIVYYYKRKFKKCNEELNTYKKFIDDVANDMVKDREKILRMDKMNKK